MSDVGDALGAQLFAEFLEVCLLYTSNSAVERRLVESRELPDVELLVVGHHGSKYSTSFELLDTIQMIASIMNGMQEEAAYGN